MRVDQADDENRPAADDAGIGRGPGGSDTTVARRGAEQADAAGRDKVASQRDAPDREDTGAVRAARAIENRATVDAAYRAHAIDQGYARVREIEHGIVTPAMLRIEAEDPTRHLAGLEHRLKGQDRLTEKVANHLKSNPDLSCDQAFAKVKDAIRYTFVYTEENYTEGIQSDVRRLGERFKIVDLRNSWTAAEYKGINSRWLISETSQIFEVQFHTQTSFSAKQRTHDAYEKIRDPATPKEVRDKLQRFQRQVSAEIPEPRDVHSIKNHP